jgi:hypothetical protein
VEKSDCDLETTRKMIIPCAFLATRSRNSNTIMLKRCDMSPAMRKIFILMVPMQAKTGTKR